MTAEPTLSPEGAWVGAAVPRKEDSRMLRGSGRFVDDIEHVGTLHAAFVRSPFASAEIGEIDTADALAVSGVRHVLTAAELGEPYLLAVLEREEFVASRMPLLATRFTRHVAEPVVVVLADDPYAAEDGAEAVRVEFTPLPAVTGLESAQQGDAPQVHSELEGNNIVDLTMFDDERLDGIFDNAALTVDAGFSSARVAALPMEGRACLANWDDRDDQVSVHVSTQVPHQVRSAIAQALRVPERMVRVLAPDVGGGFGLKCVVGREEVVVAAAAMRLRRPVKWVEDRQENLTSSFHGHEQDYQVRAAFDEQARLLGLAADIRCDIGAYSAFPFTCAVEPLMAATELPGAYKVPAYRARARGIASNKAPTAPYRGVSRPQLVLVMERLMEKAAGAFGLDPLEVRRRNLITEFPYTGPNAITYDEGSYRESLDAAERVVTDKSWYSERDRLRGEGIPAGIGFACFSERTAYGTPTMAQRRMGMTPGYDTSTVRVDPTGEVVVTSGTCAHGQSHETTFAQIVADELGVHPDAVRLRQGDTDLSSYGWGTFGSRSIVVGGGAARRAAGVVAGQLRRVAAHLLEVDERDVRLHEGTAKVRGVPNGGIDISQLAETVYFRAHTLPEQVRYALHASESADPPGTFSNAVHAVLVTADPGTGEVELNRYLVVEDCGTVINPTVVDGQIRGGVAQGVAAALYERISYDDDGQPTTATLMDYLAPTAAETCTVDIEHLQTPSAFSESGAKGMGEGGTIGAPAAVVNAVNDAVAQTGTYFDHIPVLPQDVLAALSSGGFH